MLFLCFPRRHWWGSDLVVIIIVILPISISSRRKQRWRPVSPTSLEVRVIISLYNPHPSTHRATLYLLEHSCIIRVQSTTRFIGGDVVANVIYKISNLSCRDRCICKHVSFFHHHHHFITFSNKRLPRSWRSSRVFIIVNRFIIIVEFIRKTATVSFKRTACAKFVIYVCDARANVSLVPPRRNCVGAFIRSRRHDHIIDTIQIDNS